MTDLRHRTCYLAHPVPQFGMQVDRIDWHGGPIGASAALPEG
jgi:hypothetical protein